MPIFLEPDQKFAVVLDTDQDKPVATRPTFWAKSQSMRGQQRIATVLDRLTQDDKATVEDLFNDIVNTLADVLVGWDNMSGYEFSKESLYEILTYNEARQLLRKVAYNQHIEPEKKSN